MKLNEKNEKIPHTPIVDHLKEKFNKIKENQPKTLELLDIRLSQMKYKIQDSIDDLNLKFSSLKDQLTSYTQDLEDNFNFNEYEKKPSQALSSEDIKQTEIKIKKLLLEERQQNQELADESFKQVESILIKMESEHNDRKSVAVEAIESIKNTIESDMGMSNEKIEIEAGEREKTIQSIMNEMKNEFGKLEDLVYKNYKLYWRRNK